jgi:hypothetical protein
MGGTISNSVQTWEKGENGAFGLTPQPLSHVFD